VIYSTCINLGCELLWIQVVETKTILLEALEGFCGVFSLKEPEKVFVIVAF